jgi:hypothetical protein
MCYDWQQRYGRVNEHNGWIPRDFWRKPGRKPLLSDFIGSIHSRDIDDWRS